ncbi:MAG: hypothetical protein V3U76_11975 [Granulosicoccus sp.]
MSHQTSGSSSHYGRTAVAPALQVLSTVILLGALSGCGGKPVGEQSTFLETLPAARGLLPDIAQADAAFESDHYGGNKVCASCHTGDSLKVPTEVKDEFRNVSVGPAWETSVMANATRDPYWHAVVALELDRFPHLEDEINDTCIRCHAPMAFDMANKEGLDLRLFDKGSDADGNLQEGIYGQDAASDLFNHAMDGVSCTFCHQMDATNLGTEESMSGGFVVQDYKAAGLEIRDRPAYGQYADPDAGYMAQQASFLAQPGAHISTSEACATCHNLNVSPVDVKGQPIENGHFAEQAMFSEWQNSDFRTGGPQEATCQSCHMPVLDQPVDLAEAAGNPREGYSEHVFLAANTVMQDMMMNFSDELGIPAGLNFQESIERNREFLTTAADIEIKNTEHAGDQLSFNIKVNNKSGHKLPSGYHSRRVYLHVQVLDDSGQQVFESGRIEANGSIIGVSEDVNPASWEQHYNTITSATQVQVYQAIVGSSDGNRTHSLLSGDHYLKDNRLTPMGFDKDAVNADTSLPATFGVFGKAVEDSDFNNGSDTVRYRLTLPESGSYTVFAELRYQPLSFGHLAKIFASSGRVDQIDMFRTIYDNTELRDEVIATDTAVTP